MPLKEELKATTYSVSLQMKQPGKLEEEVTWGKNQEAAIRKLHTVSKQLMHIICIGQNLFNHSLNLYKFGLPTHLISIIQIWKLKKL